MHLSYRSPQRIYKGSRALAALGLLFFGGCTSTESSVAPLGFGPLAKHEQVTLEQARVERTRATNYTGANREPHDDSQAHSSSTFSMATEHVSRVTEPSITSSASSGNTTPGPATKPADWLGLWRGNDTTRYQIPNFPSQPMDDPNARIRVESPQSQQIKLILIDSSNDKDMCTLVAVIEGNHAKVEAGQPCFGTEDDDGSLTVKVKSGQATLQSATLTLDLTLDANVESEQFQSSGSVEYHFEGKRN